MDIGAAAQLVDVFGLEPQITIDPQTGALSVGGLQLRPFQSESEIEPQTADLLERSRDHGNGYEWLYLGGLSFGGQPASLALCFREARLEQASWSVQIPDAPMQDGWPTREAIEEELTFVRSILAGFGIKVGGGSKKLPWGEVWSSFDAKGFLASNGLRYRPG